MAEQSRTCASRLEHRHLWVVTSREGYYDPGHDMRWMPSKNSTVYCPSCGVAWRTSALYVRELRDADRSAAELEPRLVRIASFVDEYPLIAELTYLGCGGAVDGDRFLKDVAHRFIQYGSLTTRQLVAVEGALQRKMRFQAEDDARRAVGGFTEDLRPRGRHTVVGTIVKAWVETEDDTGQGYERIRVQLVMPDVEWWVECTLQHQMRRFFGPEGADVGDLVEKMVGERVQVSLKMFPANNDPAKVWGTYPRETMLVRLVPTSSETS